MFSQLEIGNAVTQQAAQAGVLLVDRHRMTGPGKLLCAGQTRGTGTDDRDATAGAPLRDARLDPSLFPAFVDDRAFDRLDGHWPVGNVKRAGRLAGGGADSSRELGEIVRRMQRVERAPPVPLIDQVVPVGDQVVHRAAVVAIRNAAVHAARALLARLFLAQRDHELTIMPGPFRDRRVGTVAGRDLFKSSRLAHLDYSPTATLTPVRSAARDAACVSCRARR